MADAFLGLVCFLFGLAVTLAVVAVVGHGIWLMVAAIFGKRKSLDDGMRGSSRRRLYRTCAGCGEDFFREDERCPECGLDPASKVAAELKDLDATARTAEGLRESGLLSTAACEEIYEGIEKRRRVLLPRRRPAPIDEELPKPAFTPVQQLETWFGADLGTQLSVEEKQQALATARALTHADLRALSASALIGIARLQAAVGLLSRAFQVYRVVFDVHPEAPISRRAAVEAIQMAAKLGDWQGADDLIRIVSALPGVVEHESGLAALIEQVHARDVGHVVKPVAAPAAMERKPQVVVPAPAPVEPIAPAAAPVPAVPRRSFAEWIAVFMEQRNILWGELIGGSLIVGCSIALVISLWQTLEGIPFFPFLIFSAITSALFGAGLYTLHHWKLESTSRGLLLIGTLLVPLNFLVLAGLPASKDMLWLGYVTGFASLAVFGWFLYRSSRILIEAPLDVPVPSALLVTMAMLISGGAQLLAPAWLASADWKISGLYALTLLPVLVQVGALGWILLRLKTVEPWSVGRLVGLLIALGSVTFACAVVLGFPLSRAEVLADVLVPLSPALTLVGVPIMLAGIVTQQKLVGRAFQSVAANGNFGPTPDENDESHGLWRTLGTGLGLAGVFLMFGGFAAAIEDPIHRWLSGGINLVTLLTAAWMLRVPALHVPAQVYLAALIVYAGRFDPLEMVNDPLSALKLTGLLGLQTLLAEILVRRHRPVDARCYAIGGAVSTALAILLSLRFASIHPAEAAIVLGASAFIWLAGNLRWRIAAITYASSLALAAALYFAFWQSFDTFGERLLWALLVDATICLLTGVALRRASLDWLEKAFRAPLQFASLFATFAIVGVIALESVNGSLSWEASASACGWLAALWLLIALLEEWPMLVGAFQAALGVTWIFAIGGWLTGPEWDWREPRNLQIYALGLGVLSLVWEIARGVTRWPERVRRLLAPEFPPVDRWITGSLFIGQYVLSLLVIFWSLGRELIGPDAWRVFPIAWQDGAFSIWAWLAVVPLAGIAALRLRQRDLPIPLIGCTLLALSIPLLAAGTWFDAERAGASALRWGLVLVYGVASALLWNRQRLGELAERVPALTIRAMFVAGAVAPALWITAMVVVGEFSGQRVPGPQGGVFAAMGGTISLLIPLFLLCGALSGHGFRERLAHYLLAAGLLLAATNIGTYLLALRHIHIGLNEPWVAPGALLLATATTWLWSIAWAWTASLLETRERRPLLDSLLLTLNSVLGSMFFASVLLSALLGIIFGGEGRRVWALTAGTPWGWLAFGAMAFGACFVSWKRRASLSLHLLAFLGMAAVGVAACSAERFLDAHGFIALMFLAGLYSCAWVTSNLFIDPKQPPRWLTFDHRLLESVVYASLAAGLAVLLGSASLFNDGKDSVWSAEAIVLTALAYGLLAYQRKQELWTSVASLLVVLASTILVLHLDRANSDRWAHVIQIDLAMLGAMSLLRVALHRWLSPGYVEVAHLRQLPAQIGVGMAGNGLLLFFALVSLFVSPEKPGQWLRLQGEVAGWLALATNAVAAVWYVGASRLRGGVHVVALVGLMLGIVLAGTADVWPAGEWTAHHVLTLTWTLLALVLLVFSWLGKTQTVLGPRSWPAEDRTFWATLLRECFPGMPSQIWVAVCGGLVVAFALAASAIAPPLPAWPIGNTLAVSVLFGALAIWQGNPIYRFGSGLLFNVVGWFLFSAWMTRLNLTEEEISCYFLLTQVLCFAAAAIVWSLLEWALYREGVAVAFTQVATMGGILLFAIAVVFANGLHLSGHVLRIDAILAWVSLGGILVAVLADLWKPYAARFTRLQLYAWGLTAIGLTLYEMLLPPTDWFWTATLLLAGYVLLIVMVARGVHASARVRTLFDLPAHPETNGRWFWDVQLGTIALVVGLSLWIALTFATPQARLGGALAVSIVTLAAFLLVQLWPSIYPVEATSWFGLGQRAVPYHLTLALGIVLALTAAWALIDLHTPALALQRSAALMGVIGIATMLGRFVRPRWWSETCWSAPSRQLSAALGVVCLFLLLALLGQELVKYDADLNVRRTPLRLEWVLLAGVAIAGLAGLSLHSALTKEADSYGIEGDYRSVYVYLAELLVVALFAHVRLNLPDFFHPFVGQFWFLVVMILAGVGLAASEYFALKELPILATPLKRSAIALAFLPVLAFRLAQFHEVLTPIQGPIPGMSPFLRYLERLATLKLLDLEGVPMESLCWLLLGIFLGWLAQLRKSANYGILAALAINVGVWVVLGHQPALTFLQRPQLWLIPLGLIVLVAEFVNREKLGFWPSLSVRYVGLMCIYLSSTFEMLDSLGNPILAIALALLAVLGMLLGILFRVRAFLLVGFTALLVVIFAQIWHAGRQPDMTWVWWASGIILGGIILVMFAVFEKRRNDVIKMIDNMKHWH